jgi:hypothetical protein
MATAVIAGGANHAPSGPPTTGSVVPFFYGSNQYVERFATLTQLLDANTHETVTNINPGGYLRGVRVDVSADGVGALGGGVLNPDSPWCVINSMTLENLDGNPIIYPMAGYTHMIRQWLTRPWHGDPSLRLGFVNTANPAFSLFAQPELRHTAGCLSNTDARSQYRIRLTWATLATLIAGGAPVAPTMTANLYMEAWAQPDATDLRGNPIEELPPGLNIATIARHQTLNLAAAGAGNNFQLANMGNEVRAVIHITRTAANVRADLLAGTIRWRLDNRSMGVFTAAEVINRMTDFYTCFQVGSVRPLGVYAFPRFFQPGTLRGEAWMPTTNATYTIFEADTAAGGTGGNNEVITDEVVTIGPVPAEMESI